MKRVLPILFLLVISGGSLVANPNDNQEGLRETINLIKQEKSLVQKMVIDLEKISQGSEKERWKKDLDKNKILFNKGLKELMEREILDTTMPRIKNRLYFIDREWKDAQKFFGKYIKNQDNKNVIFSLNIISNNIDKILIYYNHSIDRQEQKTRLTSILNSFFSKTRIAKKRVNLSGRQRMLVQRMSKLALLVEKGIDKLENIKRLEKYSKLYDKTIKAFKNGDKDMGCIPSKDEKVQKQIVEIEKSWKPFYQHVQNIIKDGDKNGESIRYLIQNNEELLKLSDKLVKIYEKLNKNDDFLEQARVHIVNIAGRQRMLTQKMTKEKLLVLDGKKEYQKKLENTINLFDISLNQLINGDIEHDIVKPTNSKIEKQLDIVHKIWEELKPLYMKEKLSQKELNRIIRENPKLLKEMDKMVKMAEVEIEY